MLAHCHETLPVASVFGRPRRAAEAGEFSGCLVAQLHTGMDVAVLGGGFRPELGHQPECVPAAWGHQCTASMACLVSSREFRRCLAYQGQHS